MITEAVPINVAFPPTTEAPVAETLVPSTFSKSYPAIICGPSYTIISYSAVLDSAPQVIVAVSFTLVSTDGTDTTPSFDNTDGVSELQVIVAPERVFGRERFSLVVSGSIPAS